MFHTNHCRSNSFDAPACETHADTYWNQPERYYVEEAQEGLSDNVAWCIIAERAGRLQRKAERVEERELQRRSRC